ncbi:hypothetical protein GCM10023152_20360 [Agromyces bauzanensis]|uniref:Transposase IS4-like domain-containing protein n=1 Tax=Agromyces bauzanensis TaxID=1308924 RepID=A0A917PNT1_9MICO|nr:hypothetical protein GCM10011372_24980 [Agromyces bauzanensis]
MIADKAYSACVIRRALHARGIKVVIPEKSDQIAARKKRGRRGGRSPALDTTAYTGRNVVGTLQARHHLPRRHRPPRLPRMDIGDTL